MIRGYAEQPSPRPGETWTLRISTDAPHWRAEFFRCGIELDYVGRTDWYAGVHAPDHLPGDDWGEPGVGLHGEQLAPWASFPQVVPKDWRSGVYVVVLVEGDGSSCDSAVAKPTTPDARSGTALLVVRAATPTAPILYKLALHTYHAYNLVTEQEWRRETPEGSWCLYNMPDDPALAEHVARGVSLHRPGGGTGGYPYDTFNWDPYDSTPRQTFVHWDWRLVRWLEREGYAVDYATDVDLHRDAELLDAYRLLLCAGHDEYWSEVMRDRAERFVARGGNAAFFTGNTCWWHIAIKGASFRRTVPWYQTGRPENSLTGVSFRNGGERDREEHPEPVGFQVQHADHWVYAGTGLRDGDVFGAEEHLVGYEGDGAMFDRAVFEAGETVSPTGEDGSPADLVILGVGDCRAAGWGMGNCAATMAVYERGGTVFNGATTDWARVLTDGRCPEVEQITRNVLDRLAR